MLRAPGPGRRRRAGGHPYAHAMPAPESRRAIVIEEIATASPELVAAIAALVPQLSSSTPPPDAGGVAELLESPATTLLVARDGEGAVVGMLTVVVFRI